nr:unnamed protein product [Callosobruchus analis]
MLNFITKIENDKEILPEMIESMMGWTWGVNSDACSMAANERKRMRKTCIGENDMVLYRNAYDELKLGVSLRRAAQAHGVNYVSLLRYKRKRDAVNDDN